MSGMQENFDIAIIGAGLAGSSAAIRLARSGLKVVLIEKKKLPFHKVCGEFLSTEVESYLSELGVDFNSLGAHSIHRFHFSSPKGRDLQIDLPVPAVSISRKKLDHHLFELAKAEGARTLDHTKVESVEFSDDEFEIKGSNNLNLKARVCLGSYGKKSGLDVHFKREFTAQRSPYIGVKMHYRGEFPDHLVGLHNFRGGYCGISKIEEDKINLCYMCDKKVFNEFDGLDQFEDVVLKSNRHIAHFLEKAKPEFEKPLFISQMYFGEKELVNRHILFAGDAAGAITPLTGNGMAMAVHSGKLCCDAIEDFFNKNISRSEMEQQYISLWENEFKKRIELGSKFQRLFGRPIISELSFKFLKLYPGLLKTLISKTNGKKI